MKAELNEITEEMTGNKKLAETLNQNFEALNNMAEKREGLILSRLTEMQNSIKDLKTELSDIKTEHGSKIDLLSQNMEKLMAHFQIKPDKQLLTDNK